MTSNFGKVSMMPIKGKGKLRANPSIGGKNQVGINPVKSGSNPFQLQDKQLSQVAPSPNLKSLGDYEQFLSGMATDSAASPYAQEQQKLAGQQAESAYGNILSGAKSAAGTASNRMAMRGGRGAGVENRLNEQAQQSAQEGKQSIYNTLAQGSLGIQASDEERKQQALQDIMGIKSGQLLGAYQSNAAKNTGGLFGGGGILGSGFRF